MTTPWIVAFTLLAATVLLLAVFVLGLARRILETLNKLEPSHTNSAHEHAEFGMPLGSTAPGAADPDMDENLPPRLPSGIRGNVVLFVEANCDPCRTLIPDLASGGVAFRGLQGHIFADDGFEVPLSDLSDWNIHSDVGGETAKTWAVNATPLMYVLDQHNRIAAKGFPNSTADVNRIIHNADLQNSKFQHSKSNGSTASHSERVSST